MMTTRRDFLKLAAVVSAVTMSGYVGKALATGEANIPLSMEECQFLTPKDMAAQSPMIQNAWNYLLSEINRLENPALRSLVLAIYGDSTPQLGRMSSAERHRVWNDLYKAGYTQQSDETYLPPVVTNMQDIYPAMAAPGSGYGSHHSYPGGLVTHVATNVMITNTIVETYAQVYGYKVNRDIAMAAQLLHDLHKPWVFQWQSDASSRGEQSLAGTGEHHVLSAAELIVRQAPAELVVAQCCAHTHVGTVEEEKQVVGWLKAAAVLAGVDPVEYGLLDASGTTVPQPRRQEGFLCHLGDHDFVLSVPVVGWTLPLMREIAVTDYKLSEADLVKRPFHALRNMVYSHFSAMQLHQLSIEGKESLRRAMHSVVRPA